MRTPTLRMLVLSLSLASLVACSRETPAPSTTPSTPASASGAAVPAPAADGELVAGNQAPTFKLTASDGMSLDLAALKGKQVVLYFYPKDETPGCTKEACAFRDAWKDIEKTGVVLIGVSTDSDESHKAFAKHHELPFHLVSDKDGALAKAYGVPNRLGMLSRQSFVIGADGKIKKVYRSVDVTHHASEILADLKS